MIHIDSDEDNDVILKKRKIDHNNSNKSSDIRSDGNNIYMNK